MNLMSIKNKYARRVALVLSVPFVVPINLTMNAGNVLYLSLCSTVRAFKFVGRGGNRPAVDDVIVIPLGDIGCNCPRCVARREVPPTQPTVH